METIKLLLAHADRQVSNVVEKAVLDVFYDRAVIRSTRTSRLDELVHQGSLCDFDLIVVGTDSLFQDRQQQTSAPIVEVAKVIEEIRVKHSTPIVALTASSTNSELLLEAGVDTVLPLPLNAEQLKAELRSLLDLSGFSEEDDEELDRSSGIGSLMRDFAS
jgi:hypothetical protein